MRQVREVLRLKYACEASDRFIARSLGISRATVATYLERAAAARLTWPLPAEFDEAVLQQMLFKRPDVRVVERPQPDWPKVHAELRRRGVTLMLLWEEYRAAASEGYSYSHFCDLYRAWLGRVSPTMRQTHLAGDKMFVDYAGQTIDVMHGDSGELRAAQIFVAVLGASNYTYAEARWTQSLPDWIGCHVNTFAFFGGVTRQVVCDNLKAGITTACRYEPGINRTYQECAAHYGTAILPTRVRKPRDKAKVEVAVQVVERWILARLRNQQFFSLGELNAAIRELLVVLNDRAMRRLDVSRREMFEIIDRPALRSLPATPYHYAQWRTCRVGLDYHVEVHGHFYSVPHRLLRQQLEARITERTVELFHRGVRVASHMRNPRRHRHTTVADHMPSAHRRYATWSPARLIREAQAIGTATATLVETILEAKPHPEQGFRSCLGILRLKRSYGAERLEAACVRGLDIGARSYASVASILKNGLDRCHRPEPTPDPPPIWHGNVRGHHYYTDRQSPC